MAWQGMARLGSAWQDKVFINKHGGFMDQVSVRSCGNWHPVSIRLKTELEKGKPGDILSDSQLKEIAGLDVGTKSRHCGYLYTAIRHLEPLGIKWKRDPGQSRIRCLNDLEKTENCYSAIKHIGKTARKSARVMATVKPDNIPAEKRGFATAVSAQLGAVALLSKSTATTKLISSVNNHDPKETLKLFVNDEK